MKGTSLEMLKKDVFLRAESRQTVTWMKAQWGKSLAERTAPISEEQQLNGATMELCEEHATNKTGLLENKTREE